ncbi:hypothetical protein [uncultured Desulfobulbus sp.]|uniref:hypothetical protein n=1 Tax=uncultured Desulfobulbus sp. TaxID=239745 RepID=UPI0029C71D6E|nr:hypothetical protein [uncultured Desulfobulbus sp.]
MKYTKRIVVGVLLAATLGTSGIVFAGETGQKNTRNALGAATVIMAVKGNKTGTILGAAGTVIASEKLNKTIRARHRRDAYRRAHRLTRAQRARIYRAKQARIKQAKINHDRRAWLLKQKNAASAKKY